MRRRFTISLFIQHILISRIYFFDIRRRLIMMRRFTTFVSIQHFLISRIRRETCMWRIHFQLGSWFISWYQEIEFLIKNSDSWYQEINFYFLISRNQFLDIWEQYESLLISRNDFLISEIRFFDRPIKKCVLFLDNKKSNYWYQEMLNK